MKNNSLWVFNLHNQEMGIPRTLAEGIQSRIFAGEKSMLSVVRFAPNSVGKIHSHAEEQWGVLLEGDCVRIQGDEEIAVKAGDFWHTPSGVSHGIRVSEKGALVLDIFSPPRPEYRKAGAGFGKAQEKMAGGRKIAECLAHHSQRMVGRTDGKRRLRLGHHRHAARLDGFRHRSDYAPSHFNYIRYSSRSCPVE